MPFKSKSRKGWRGQVKWGGKIYRADFPTRQEAVVWEVKKKEELQQQAMNQDQTRTGSDLVSFFNLYLDEGEIRFVRDVFLEKKALTHRFLETCGNMPVNEVTSEMIRRYLKVQVEKRSANSSNRDRKNLMAMWHWGQDFLDIANNPVVKTKPLPHDRAPQYTPPTTDVLKLLAAATREERVFLDAYLQTGARRSEVFRWRWTEDINFANRQVRLGTRKTKGGGMSYEWLPMSDELHDALWWWFNNRPVKDTDHVFVSTSKNPGRHYGQPYRERRWFMKTLCKRAGIKEFGFHALRRYVASYLADTHKVSSKAIQRILRHKNLATTERYIQRINTDLTSVVALLGGNGLPNGLPKDGKEVGNCG